MKLTGTNAVITGAGRKGRVGHALALALARAGVNIIVHYGSSKDEALEVVREIKELGVKATSFGADLSKESAATDIFDFAKAELGSVEILINSASGFAEDTVKTVTKDGLLKTLEVTLFAPMLLTQALANSLPADKKAVVINITDRKVDSPYKNHFSYMIAKGGVNQLTKTAAVELGPQVRVNAIALGAISPPPGKSEGYVKELVKNQPIPEAGGTIAVEKAMLYLLDNDFVTGQIVTVDGGASLI